MVVTTMTILTTNGIYNVVIWTTQSCSRNKSQMAITTNFVVVNVVVNATFWRCDVKCYELKQFMQQNVLEFVNMLNKLRTLSQNSKHIEFINKICIKLPPIDNI
jgi:hypothetical protein